MRTFFTGNGGTRGEAPLSLPRTFDTRHKVVPALQIQFGIDDLERLQDRLRGTLRRPLSV